jgi:hypothetical protein
MCHICRLCLRVCFFVRVCVRGRGPCVRGNVVGGASRGGGGERPGARMVPDDPSDVFQAVSCASCGTEVGVVDADEVYHFFDVFPNMGSG